jgi:hypothetical protein
MALECATRVMAGGRFQEHIPRWYCRKSTASGSMTRAVMVAQVELSERSS